MAAVDFINQLQALGYETQELAHGMVGIIYTVPVGENSSNVVELAFQISNDFPMNCPPGPHFKSGRIVGWKEPGTNIHSSPLGGDWRYWSRPFPDWNRSQKNVKVYFSHIKNLLIKL